MILLLVLVVSMGAVAVLRSRPAEATGKPHLSSLAQEIDQLAVDMAQIQNDTVAPTEVTWVSTNENAAEEVLTGDTGEWTFALSSQARARRRFGYAAMASASIRTVAISGLSGRVSEAGIIRSRQRTRRSSAIASAKDGTVLAVYQG